MLVGDGRQERPVMFDVTVAKLYGGSFDRKFLFVGKDTSKPRNFLYLCTFLVIVKMQNNV